MCSCWRHRVALKAGVREELIEERLQTNISAGMQADLNIFIFLKLLYYFFPLWIELLPLVLVNSNDSSLSWKLPKYFLVYNCYWDNFPFKDRIPLYTMHLIRLQYWHSWYHISECPFKSKFLNNDSDNQFDLGRHKNSSLGYFVENKNLPYLFNVYTLSTLYVYNIIQGKQT